jgi:hypothetical protein
MARLNHKCWLTSLLCVIWRWYDGLQTHAQWRTHCFNTSVSYLMTLSVSGLYGVYDMMINWSGVTGGMRIGRGDGSTRRKAAPESPCSPQIPYDLMWDHRTRAASVESRRLTARAMPQRPLFLSHRLYLISLSYLWVLSSKLSWLPTFRRNLLPASSGKKWEVLLMSS